MPLYICSSRKNALDDKAKQEIAKSITNIHCSVTGAPASFVHAFFFEDSRQFPLNDKELIVRGTIRRGRSDQQKTEIKQAVNAALVKHSNADEHQVESLIRETPASWVMEGGEIMPEPGEEDEWFAAQEQRRQGLET